MKKRLTNILSLICVLALCSGMIGTACARDMGEAALRSSYYIDYYSAWASTGTKREVVISFDVSATNYMELVGANYIVVQEKSGSDWKGVATYWGSTSNGMMASNVNTYAGSITYNGTSGKQYRAVITVYAGDAENDALGDYRTKTTTVVTAQ